MFIDEYARGSIYRLTFSNGKVYIGQTMIPFEKRLQDHQRVSAHKQSKLYNGWRKHGLVAADVVFVCRIRDLSEYETLFIAEYDSFENGYNSTTGGDVPEFSPEVRAKIKAHSNSIEERAARSDRAKKQNACPLLIAVKSEKTKKQWEDPAFRSAVSDGVSVSMRRLLADPAYIAKRYAATANSSDPRFVCHQVAVELDGVDLGTFRSTHAAFEKLRLSPYGNASSKFRLKLKAAHLANPGAALTFNAADGKAYVFRVV